MSIPVMTIPNTILKRLYTFGSLRNTVEGVQFSIKNRLSDTQVVGVSLIQVDGFAVPARQISLDLGDGARLTPDQISELAVVDFPLRRVLTVMLAVDPLAAGTHNLQIVFHTSQFGELAISVEDSIAEASNHPIHVPRDDLDDYAPDIVEARQQFAAAWSGVELTHIKHFAFDPHVAKGNCENFTGVAQIPLGLAGPITSTANTRRAIFSSRWRPPKGRWWPPIIAGSR